MKAFSSTTLGSTIFYCVLEYVLYALYLKEGRRPCLLIDVILLEETFAQPGRARRGLVYVSQ